MGLAMGWGSNKKPSQGLPDLEAHLKNIFKSLFGLHKPSQSGPSPVSHHSWKTWATGLVVALSMWGISGIYQVQPTEQAVVTSFGKVRAANPGWHWFARFIENKYIVDTSQTMTANLTDSIISQDQAVASLQLNVQYQVKNAQQYFFNMSNINSTLQQIVEAKLTQNAGGLSLAQLLQTNPQLNQTLQQQIQQICDQYTMGITVTNIAIQNVQVPNSVQSVLDSIQNANQASQSLQNNAQQQADVAMQDAKSQAEQIIKQAQEQAALAVPRAQREVAEFMAILPAYEQNPQVTRARMYYDTMQKVYANSHIIVVDSNANVTLPANLLQAELNSASASNNSAPITVTPNAAVPTDNSKKMSAYLRWKGAQESES
ncbi:MAG: HflK protein [Gammaproteobacteria bacterium]|nr:HflK protein [Gammaproteobacteria bacterium]